MIRLMAVMTAAMIPGSVVPIAAVMPPRIGPTMKPNPKAAPTIPIALVRCSGVVSSAR